MGPNLIRKRAEYCFKSTVSEERTHWVRRKLSEFCRKLGGFARHTYSRLRGTQWALCCQLGEQKNSLSSVFETVLSGTVSGPFPIDAWSSARWTWKSARLHRGVGKQGVWLSNEGWQQLAAASALEGRATPIILTGCLQGPAAAGTSGPKLPL